MATAAATDTAERAARGGIEWLSVKPKTQQVQLSFLASQPHANGPH